MLSLEWLFILEDTIQPLLNMCFYDICSLILTLITYPSQFRLRLRKRATQAPFTTKFPMTQHLATECWVNEFTNYRAWWPTPWSFVTPHLCTFAYKSSQLGGGVTQRGREREGGGRGPTTLVRNQCGTSGRPWTRKHGWSQHFPTHLLVFDKLECERFEDAGPRVCFGFQGTRHT